MLYDNLGISTAGHLTVAGHDTVELAEKFGAPLYLLDAQRVRARCRTYRQAMTAAFGGSSGPLYASKALAFRGIYRLMAQEQMRVDVVSSGELYTALSAGFPAKDIYFHGNNKTDADIAYGLDSGIGCFIIDNPAELRAVEAAAAQRGRQQTALLRLSPGIDPHTFAAVNTGQLDCQFGAPIETGQALDFVRQALECPHIDLAGFHCHIGSQIFDAQPFRDAADIMLLFAAQVRRETGYTLKTLNLGGGFGVPYVVYDPTIDIAAEIAVLGRHVHDRCREYGLPVPEVLMEPGRSIVADSGVTLYRVGGVKEVGGFRNFVTVDGGMTDNPRYALYKSAYTVMSADHAGDPATFPCTLTGRCCETGDRIQEDIRLPRPQRGDLIAVLTTGAYNYSMASNYNRLPRPALLMLDEDGPQLAVRRETFQDLTACDL